MNKIRILYITCFGSLQGGGQRSLLLLLTYLNKDLFEPRVVVPESGELKRKIEELNIPVDIIPMPKIRSLRFLSFLKTVSRLRRLLCDRRIDVVSTDNVRETAYAALARRGLKIRLILHARVTDSKPWVDRILYALCDCLIAVSGATADRFRRLGQQHKLHVVYNGIDLQAYRPVSVQKRDDIFRIGFLGRLEYRKGVDILIEAFRRLNDVRAQLLIYGEGEDSLVQQLQVQAAGLQVRFLGFHSDPLEVIQGLDLVVLPSRYGEGLSRVIVEAMALGKPVVVSDSPSNPEAVGSALAGLTFSLENTGVLVDILQRCLRDQAFVEESGRLARLRAEEVFDLKKNTRALELIYSGLIDSR